MNGLTKKVEGRRHRGQQFFHHRDHVRHLRFELPRDDPWTLDELDILDIAVGQKAEITADAISDRTFEGVVTSISSAGTTSGGTTTYPVTIRIDDTGSLMPGMNATAALDIPPCRRYVIVKATAGFAVFRLILKSLLFYSCLDFTQNLGKTHFCLTFGVHFSIRSLFFGIFFNVFAIGIYSFDSCFLSTAWIS